FTTFGLFPLALLTTTLLIAALRASYESVTGNLLRVVGVRRRALLVGSGRHLTHLHHALGESRGGIAYSFVGAIAPEQTGVDLPVLGDRAELPAVLVEHAVDELIVSHERLAEAELAEPVEPAHRRGVQARGAPEA